jgi:transglutaminase-like putative cysteine protease
MYLERLLQVNLATLAALSALLLGMGERSLVAPLAVCTAAVLSVWLTDVKGALRVPRLVTSLAALAAMIWALRQSTSLEGEALLLNIGHLLVVLQIILLFQSKDDRTYGQLAMLSLLQVMVATLFNQGVWFGALLVLHALVGISALALLFLVRQHRPYWRAAIARPPTPAAAPRRWPLATGDWTLVDATAGSSRVAAGPELFRRLAGIGLFTLLVSLLVFFTLPRGGETAWRVAGAGSRSLVGFNDTMALGEMGEILESREEVLRIRFVDAATNELYRVNDEVLLRGGLLSRYDGGRWTTYRGHGEPMRPMRREQSGFVATPPVKQRVTIEPLDRRELFCVWPFVETEDNPAIHYDGRAQRLLRSEARSGVRFSYELGTTAFEAGAQSPIVPCDEVTTDRLLVRLLQKPDLPRLESLAARWADESGLPATDRIGLARYLESKLRDSGEFSYSLQGQARNLAVDPIEDFVSEHRVGHCEYFATALAMMLRSQDIPSRVVVGYRCDEWNELGKFFQVRQLHAHSWVEAYLKPSQVPRELFHSDDHWRWASGGWLRLDATPGSGETAAEASAIDGLRSRWNWLQDAWSNYVMEMDRQRQREAVYEPLLRGLRALGSAQWWREQLTALGEAMGFAAGAAWWAAVLVVSAAALVLLGAVGGVIWWATRRWRLRRRGRLGRAPGRSGPVVEFYRRFERALARQRIVRGDGQTQREFAGRARQALAQRGADSTLLDSTQDVADAFYRVRFGHAPLDSAEAEAVEHAVAMLEHWAAAALPPSQ